MPDTIKKPAAVLLAIVAVIALILSGYKYLVPQARNNDDAALHEFMMKATPEQLERMPAAQREMILKEREKSK